MALSNDSNSDKWQNRMQAARDNDVRLLFSYLTRPGGFCDALLSAEVCSSAEVYGYMGRVQTHRGGFQMLRRYISLCLGTVAWRYALRDPFLQKRDWKQPGPPRGGLGFFFPADLVLDEGKLDFSASISTSSGVVLKDMPFHDVVLEYHRERKQRPLMGDGFGNMFEASFVASENNVYPRLRLSESTIVCIPKDRYHGLMRLLRMRQGFWRKQQTLAEANSSLSPHRRSLIRRELFLKWVARYTSPFDIGRYKLNLYESPNIAEEFYRQSLTI